MMRAVSKSACAWVVAALLGSTLMFAQEPRPASTPAGEAAIQALVSEIRELRMSLERSNFLMLRFQAALQANQIHSDRLKELSQQLDSVKTQLSQIDGERTMLTEEIKNADRDLANSDPSARRQAEQQVAQLRAVSEGVVRKEADLRSRESMLVAEIQRETTQMEDWRRWLQQFEQYLQSIK
jgi:hypothetical protein